MDWYRKVNPITKVFHELRLVIGVQIPAQFSCHVIYGIRARFS